MLAVHPIPARGVFREASARPGYVMLTVVDSMGRILERAEMIAEWCDDDCTDAAYARLARSDPDYEHRTHTIRMRVMPLASSVLPFPALAVSSPERPSDREGLVVA